jgi:hypothetical protein
MFVRPQRAWPYHSGFLRLSFCKDLGHVHQACVQFVIMFCTLIAIHPWALLVTAHEALLVIACIGKEKRKKNSMV